jgi:hypothetical protein
MTVVYVPIRTNPQIRQSRLVRSVPSFLSVSAVTILRFYTMYRPLRVFMTFSALAIGVALLLGVRFLYFFALGKGAGHVQSLILAAILTIVGFQVGLIGLLADSMAMNRRLMEETLYRIRQRQLGGTADKDPGTSDQ